MQGELFPIKSARPLHVAVLPRGNREDMGETGEAIYQLADTLQAHGGNVLVERPSAPDEVWRELITFINNSPRRRDLVRGNFRALRALRRHAGRV